MNKQQGFSLLEILVAFSILAISLGILLKIFSSGVNTAVIAEEYTVATQISESLMAVTGVEEILSEGEKSGTKLDKYHWRVNTLNIENPANEADENTQLFRVQVAVQWGDENQNPRMVELNTIKTGQKD